MSAREPYPVALRRKALPRCSLRAVAARLWPYDCLLALALAHFCGLHRPESPAFLAQDGWETEHSETDKASLP